MTADYLCFLIGLLGGFAVILETVGFTTVLFFLVVALGALLVWKCFDLRFLGIWILALWGLLSFNCLFNLTSWFIWFGFDWLTALMLLSGVFDYLLLEGLFC